MTLSEGTVADHVAARALVVALLEGQEDVLFKARGVHLQQRGPAVVRDSAVGFVSGPPRISPQHLFGLESGRGRRGARPPEAAHGGDSEDPGQRRLRRTMRR